MMIGPAFTGDTNLEQELKTHAVSLWLVDDVITCLDEQIGPAELLPAFAPGHAADAIADILRERAHGRRKRIAVLFRLIIERAWPAQMTLAGNVAAEDAPALAEDSLLLPVDDKLTRQGVAGGMNRAGVRDACMSAPRPWPDAPPRASAAWRAARSTRASRARPRVARVRHGWRAP